MRTFDYKKIAEYSWDNEVLSYVAKIHECKGRQELYLKQRPAGTIRDTGCCGGTLLHLSGCAA